MSMHAQLQGLWVNSHDQPRELSAYLAANPSQEWLVVELQVSEERDDGGNDLLYAWFTTIDRKGDFGLFNEYKPRKRKHVHYVEALTPEKIAARVKEVLDLCPGENYQEAFDKLRKYFLWEYELNE